MSIGVYDLGEPRRLSIVFTHIDTGQPTDPTTVTLRLTRPSGSVELQVYGESPSNVARSGDGAFYADITFDEIGDWDYQWIGTGAVGVIEPGQFHVKGNP